MTRNIKTDKKQEKPASTRKLVLALDAESLRRWQAWADHEGRDLAEYLAWDLADRAACGSFEAK
ncbi:MAG: hypothetical protein LBK99_01595 [Opitutaceae bacterium]|jgi:hypothetical protein|nr:hypothetical protein [Opitutaceae bacterium]